MFHQPRRQINIKAPLGCWMMVENHASPYSELKLNLDTDPPNPAFCCEATRSSEHLQKLFRLRTSRNQSGYPKLLPSHSKYCMKRHVATRCKQNFLLQVPTHLSTLPVARRGAMSIPHGIKMQATEITSSQTDDIPCWICKKHRYTFTFMSLHVYTCIIRIYITLHDITLQYIPYNLYYNNL